MSNMTDYIKEMVQDFKKVELDLKTAKTPAAEHLFQVRDDVEKLSEKKAVIFHNMVARALYVCKRLRPDIQTAVAFLTTRVRSPDLDDWKKLKRMMGNLLGQLRRCCLLIQWKR